MKSGRYFKLGDKIPEKTIFIEYKSEPFDHAIITRAETELTVTKSYGRIYELLDFAFPKEPPQPKETEVWEVEFRATKTRHLARYQGERCYLQEVFGCENFSFYPFEVNFIRRWNPEE